MELLLALSMKDRAYQLILSVVYTSRCEKYRRKLYININIFICVMKIILCGSQIKKNEVGGAYGTYERQERFIRGLVGRPEGKRLLGRPWRRWKDYIKTDL